MMVGTPTNSLLEKKKKSPKLDKFHCEEEKKKKKITKNLVWTLN